MIERVEHFEAELDVHAFVNAEQFSQRHVAGDCARTFEPVLCGIAKSKVRREREAVDVEPVVDASLAARQVAVADLIGAIQAVRTRVGRIKAHLRRKVESGMQSDDSTEMPSTQNQVRDSAGI